jgi:hypothetical protein
MALAVCAAVVERGDTVTGWLVAVDCKEPEHPLAPSARAVPLARYVRKRRRDSEVSMIMLLSSASLWYQLMVLSRKIFLKKEASPCDLCVPLRSMPRIEVEYIRPEEDCTQTKVGCSSYQNISYKNIYFVLA